jgi:hypothetical protein
MMIAVAIAGALFTYAWVMGYIGFQTEKSGESIQIQSVFSDGTDLKVYVQNVGEGVVQLEEDSCLYVDGILVSCSIDGVTVSDDMATLGQGETATLRYSGGAPSQIKTVNVKVVTVHGTATEDVYRIGSGDGGSVSIMWNQTYKGTGADFFCSVVETSDGGYALAGWTTLSSANVDYDFWLVKTDEYGNMEWNKTYGGTGDDRAFSLVEASDGGYVLAGRTESFSAGNEDAWLVKTDAYGNMEWNKTYGGFSNDGAMCVVATSDGGYAFVGSYTNRHTSLPNIVEHDFWLVKTDASGQMTWNRTYGNMEWNKTYGATYSDYAHSLVVTSDGGYAIAGITTISSLLGNDDFWLVKTDAMGNMDWNRTYGGTESDIPLAVVTTSDGGYAIAGTTNTFDDTSNDFWLVKTDASGQMTWNQTYGGTETDDGAFSLVVTSDGGYALAGYTTSLGSGGRDFLLVKTDVAGTIKWKQTYGGTENEAAYSLIATSDEGYAIAGYKNDDLWLIKTDEYGNTR